MDAVKLKNSCICGNILPYAECCGPYGRAGALGDSSANRDARGDFRRDLHDLYMYLFPHRNLYQAYWERLSQEEYPHHLLMADADYGRAVMANFFWDYSVQFSDARPILRAARDVEEKDLRLANDFRQWSLSPLWLWQVVESDGRRAHVRMADSGKTVRVEHNGELPGPGGLFAGRILPHRGREQVHPAVLVFPETGHDGVLDKLRGVCRNLGLKSGSGLRPDVHCEEWRRHGALILALWREVIYDAQVGVPARTMTAPQSFRLPVGSVGSAGSSGARGAFMDTARQLRAGGAVGLDARRFEVRHRALTLARLEIETIESEVWLNVTLLDEAYRPRVFHWLADHLGGSGAAAAAPRKVDDRAPAPGDWIAWAQSAQDSLGGETPLEAITHDFGRRRLHTLLSGLALSDGELTALYRQLGLAGDSGLPGL
jgi:hypothetical protein